MLISGILMENTELFLPQLFYLSGVGGYSIKGFQTVMLACHA